MIESRKTPGINILGVFLCLLLAQPLQGLADCGRGSGPPIRVDQVIDGDTLRLADGRSVRVIGINAPEVKRGAKAGQPLGNEARIAARAFIAASGDEVQLGYEQEKKDHYGRLLAHVYNTQGKSLGAELLTQGLVFAIAIPPNVAQSDCLYRLQHKAREQGYGIWGHRAWHIQPSAGLTPADIGFRRIAGRIEKVTINSAVWIELEGQLVIQIARDDWSYFPQQRGQWLSLKGRRLEAEGWISYRRPKNTRFKPLMMRVRSPHALRVISP